MIKQFLVFFLLSSAAFADVFQYPIESKNLADVQKIIPQPALMRGNFEQIKTIKGSPKKFISNGSFIFSKEKGLYWNIKKPFPSIIVFTKNGLLKIEDGNREIISASDRPYFQEFSEIFQSIFSGDTQKIQHSFNIFFKKNNQTWTLGLQSNSDIMKNVITEIIIKGDKSYTKEMLLKEQHGDSTIIKLKNVATAPKPLTTDEENYFKF